MVSGSRGRRVCHVGLRIQNGAREARALGPHTEEEGPQKTGLSFWKPYSLEITIYSQFPYHVLCSFLFFP